MKLLVPVLLSVALLAGCGMTGTSEKRVASTKDLIADEQDGVVKSAIKTTGSSVSSGINSAIRGAISGIFN